MQDCTGGEGAEGRGGSLLHHCRNNHTARPALSISNIKFLILWTPSVSKPKHLYDDSYSWSIVGFSIKSTYLPYIGRNWFEKEDSSSIDTKNLSDDYSWSVYSRNGLWRRCYKDFWISDTTLQAGSTNIYYTHQNIDSVLFTLLWVILGPTTQLFTLHRSRRGGWYYYRISGRGMGPLGHSRHSESILFHFCHTTPSTASNRGEYL